MSPIWKKVWRDLANNKARTFLVVLSTAVGVFALGLVFGLSDMLRGRMTADHQAMIPAHITFWGGAFNQAVIDIVQEEPQVGAVEGQTQIPFRWKLPGENHWRNGELVARADYARQPMNRVDLLQGRWPGERTLTVERQSSRFFGITQGTTVLVALGRHEEPLPVEGIARSSTAVPPQFGGDATFYATPDTVAWLTQVRDFNLLHIRLKVFSEEQAERAAQAIESRLDRMGRPVGGYIITDPNVHWMQEMVDTLSLVLVALGALSLALSGFLIINTMNAIIAQQVWQIGVMKVIGATFGRVMRVYLTGTFVYGLLACLIAVPLGTLGAHFIAGWLLTLINLDPGPFRAVPFAVTLQLAVGLTVPVIAGLIPVITGARITPHQAISSYGLGSGFGQSWLDRLVGRIRHLPRLLALSLRNTFRRKGRVALTLLALALGGVMFITVMSVGTSLDDTLEGLINELGMDIWVVFDRPRRVARLIEIARSTPGVTLAEVWGQRGAAVALTSGEEREIYLLSVPPNSEMLNPNIVEGRRLLPEDDRAILLNSKVATEEGLQVGDDIELTIDDQRSVWTIVGLILSVSENQQACYVPFDALGRELGSVDRGTIVAVMIDQPGVAREQALMRSLRETYTERGLKPAFLRSVSEMRQQNRTQFNIITYLMLAMAILAAIVGGIGIMGTMSINVVERSREIGVMRAVGATSPAVVGIFVSEGILLGALSWIIAAPLSYPGARLFSDLIGTTLLGVPLSFSYSVDGLVLWLLIVAVSSSLASLWPALKAARISVREALAYE